MRRAVVAPRAGGATDVVRHLETGRSTTRRSRGASPTPSPRSSPTRAGGSSGDRAREVVARRTWSVAVDELVEEHYASLLAGPLRLAA